MAEPRNVRGKKRWGEPEALPSTSNNHYNDNDN
jgi:hypothetical protein